MSNWLQISVIVAQPAVQRTIEVMDVLGAIAVSRRRARGDTRFDLALPEFQGWEEERVTGLFPGDADQRTIRTHLQDLGGQGTAIELQVLEERDWELANRDRFRPVRIKGDLWVCPSWCQPEDPDAINLVIDPGLAFGTGTHTTTQLCLERLLEMDLHGLTVLDWGCGSGILAVAALQLGASRVTAVDVDPKALIATKNNARDNQVGGHIEVTTPEQMIGQESFDVVVANILAHTLIDLAPRLRHHLALRGTMLLSGILAAQGERVRSAFGPGYTFETVSREEWILLVGAQTT